LERPDRHSSVTIGHDQRVRYASLEAISQIPAKAVVTMVSSRRP
jgi:hypothetical protein